MVPEAVMICDTHSVESDALGLFDQLIGFNKAVDRSGVRMGVNVYYQLGCTALRVSGSIVESVTSTGSSQENCRDQLSSMVIEVTASPGVRAVAGSLGEMAFTTSMPSTTSPKTACAPSR